MKLKCCWLYHDIMDLYGDKGNIMVLTKRCMDRGIQFELDTCSIGEEKDFSQYHLLFLGGGADKEQRLLAEDLRSKKDSIVKALDAGTFMFLVCGGFQMFGQYYIDSHQNKIEGLKIFDYYTESMPKNKRAIGNILIQTKLEDETYDVIGFENHGGMTKGITTPFGRVIKGYGNNGEDQGEGFLHEQVLGTYIHGPLLPKNPKVADYIIYKSLKKEYQDLTFASLLPLDDTLENQARSVMIKRISN